VPIDKEEFQGGRSASELEDDIVLFLEERKGKAFTTQEIMGGTTSFLTDFTNSDIARMSAFAIADFSAVLYELAKRKITMKIIKDRTYFSAGEESARCPKCKMEISGPKKTWNMTGRRDKRGERFQLHMGIFECPKDGTFRTVLGKQKI
jgi:hypothetical protein